MLHNNLTWLTFQSVGSRKHKVLDVGLLKRLVHLKELFINVLKNSSSLSFLISSSQGILNAALVSWILLLKNACLHVSFTAYENFYKLSKIRLDVGLLKRLVQLKELFISPFGGARLERSCLRM